ncbi:MAG: hypothetical protein DWQ01_09075 [Planctomycetota bacterium]|nr:MAG: hypothetical protein DWQ01_09075 [Planctomycetota bacterium]
MTRLPHGALVVPALCLLSAPAFTQIQIYGLDGQNAGDQFGYKLAAIGDINCDSVDDFMVSAINEDAGDGRVRVYSGADGSLLYNIGAGNSDGFFGSDVAGPGDVDGDNIPDLLIGQRFFDGPGSRRGRALVLSGADLNPIYEIVGQLDGSQLGFSVAAAGDVNQDGFADFMVGGPWGNWAGTYNGRAIVVSGQDGSFLYDFIGADRDSIGYLLSPAGDVDGDQFDDFIIGSPYIGLGGGFSVYSGVNGQELYFYSGFFQYPTTVSAGFDINQDGFDDFMAGSAWNVPYSGAGYGHVDVFSGADGTALFAYLNPGTSMGTFGDKVEMTPDLNGDGFPDFLVYFSDPVGYGNVRIYSGQDGSLLASITDGGFADRFGETMARIGDLNFDGMADFLVGGFDMDNNGAESGHVSAYSMATPGPAHTLRVSMKRVLGPGFTYDPQWSDANIQQWAQEVNDLYSRTMNVEIDLPVEIVDIVDPVDPFSLFDADITRKAEMEDAMELDPERFAWRCDAINVYLVDTLVDGSGNSIGGSCSFPGGLTYDDIILMQPNIANDSVGLAHEIGHYLDLMHTFETGIGVENQADCATGFSANWSTTGDLVCDTPGDPNDEPTITGWYGAGSCFGAPPPVGTTSPEHIFNRLRYNTMSYYQTITAAEALFTPGQVSRMRQAIRDWRTHVTVTAVNPEITSIQPSTDDYPGPYSLVIDGTNLPTLGTLEVWAGTEMGTVSMATDLQWQADFFQPITPGLHTVGLFQDGELVAFFEDGLEIRPYLEVDFDVAGVAADFTLRSTANQADLLLLIGNYRDPVTYPFTYYQAYVDPLRTVNAVSDANGFFTVNLGMATFPAATPIALQFVEMGNPQNWFSNYLIFVNP